MLFDYLLIINVLSFIMCILDKFFAIKKKYRISEKLLMLVSALGGVFGMVIGMHLVRHKTIKKSFNIPIYILFIIWTIGVVMVLCSI